MGAIVAAGPSNTVVVDKQGMYWMAGKACLHLIHLTIFADVRLQWKNSGEGLYLITVRSVGLISGLRRVIWFTLLVFPLYARYHVRLVSSTAFIWH